jgi:hypothetical protein
MTTTAPAPPAHPEIPGEEPLWMTTTLRPAGPMGRGGAARFSRALRAAADSSEVVLVDLRAVGPLPRRARRALAEADTRLAGAGGALLVVDGDGDAPSAAHLLASES